MLKFIFCLVLLIPSLANAQVNTDSVSAGTDSVKINQLKEVVVTATQTEKNPMQVPLPVSQISGQEIRNRGLVRLNEILAEQTGLAVLPDAHGQGVQMQGFSPDYTMIMIDGLPLIGRTTGILELSRITTNNVDKIEIVKGPVSSLYGSEAMAGVINIITATPQPGVSGSFSSRYGTNNTADLSLSAGYGNEKLTASGFVNRYSSSGYSLQPQSGSPTVSPFYGYTLSGKMAYKLGRNTDLNLSIRNYNNNQTDRYLVDSRQVSGDGSEKDFNLSPSVIHRFSEKLTGTLRLYRSTYRTQSALNYTDDHTLYDESYFNQDFNRAEIQGDYKLNRTLRLTSGVGGQYEQVEATRYDQKESFTSGYLYAQADWYPLKKLNVIAGGRYDAHSVYKSQFSPKLAASYSLFSNKFVILASAGKGYKAPDFRQLYLDFTNAVVGYTVFGYEQVKPGIARLQQDGQIQTILVDPASLNKLNAESSTAYNFGYRYSPFKNLMWTVNAFRNNISDLIDSEPIAIKTNGQSVYSYSNIYKVYTRGIETEVNYRFFKNWAAAGGFQYLEAYDESVVDKIRQKQVFGTDPQTREAVRVTMSDYGGLLNRSKYMANVRLTYQENKYGLTASLRAIYRGRYGFSDADGNGIVNRDDEYVKGYTLFNASVSKLLFKKRLCAQLTAENLFDYKAPLTISNLPGRLLYAGISYHFSKNNVNN
ncbi:TonB-dependent receptor (plasmid) [Pedobacter sp. BS3]|uniref:TonB-dependent receptor plug domain-containing protein n=1 Tax=Pedobacter sp. BS3 TaxID=2567937 RepID=UPI0011EBAC4B|nr:TonB-dependent receptor [Pedobacter sp. BS3]TZF85954.1 TonB-dependent receptor [Pedobacter sp. BS3]